MHLEMAGHAVGKLCEEPLELTPVHLNAGNLSAWSFPGLGSQIQSHTGTAKRTVQTVGTYIGWDVSNLQLGHAEAPRL